jgi:hypothetical protein
MRSRWFLAIALAVLATPLTRADTIVLPNANTSVSGNAITGFPLGDGDRTFQWVYSNSQLSSVVGDQITSLGFRLPSGASTVTIPLNFTAWNLQVGTSLNAPGSLSSNFAANQGAGTLTVLSGPLTIPANSLIGGAGPNPFLDLNFTTPFTYLGGDLLFTLSLSGNTDDVAVDANTLPNPVTDTVGDQFSFNATTGTAQFFNSPVTQIGFAPPAPVVPEPSALALAGLGLTCLAIARTLRRRWHKSPFALQ